MPGMGAMPGMGGNDLGLPMMDNKMASFMGVQPGQQMQMGGGKSQPLQKYKLTLDKNFFF